MAAAILHIVFSDAAGATLRGALAGTGERVVVLADNLAVGPIAGAGRGETALHAESLSAAPRRLVWTDRRVAGAYAGLLAWVAEAGDTPFDVVDLTHAGTAPLEQLPPAAIAGLRERAAAISAEARADLVDDWRVLRAENAPLRIIDRGRLVSAPADGLDAAILRRCSRFWTRRSLVMDAVLIDDAGGGVWNMTPAWLTARIDVLVTQGKLEAGIDPKRTGHAEIRLPDTL